MATATRICKVCGKEYEYCHTFRKSATLFRWQDVACCPEHGNMYFEKVLAARARDSEADQVRSPAEERHHCAFAMKNSDEDLEDPDYIKAFEEDFDEDPDDDFVEY